MIANRLFRSKPLAVVLLIVLAGLLVPGAAMAQGQEKKTDKANLSGRVFKKDMSPAEGAIIKIRHQVTGQIHQSLPADIEGLFSFYGVPPGRYAVGVSHAGDDFNLNYTLVLRAGDSGTLSMCLDPSTRMAARECGERSFFQKNGVAMIVVVGAIGAAIYTFSQPEAEASPIK